MSSDSQNIRKAILSKWHESLSKQGNLFSSDSLSGSSPPSVFVGRHLSYHAIKLDEEGGKW